MKIKLNSDQEVVDTIREGLKRTSGYCPCRVERIVKIIPKLESCSERRRRMSYGVEWKPLSSSKTPIPFQYTYDLV